MAEISRAAQSDDDWAAAPTEERSDAYTPERGHAAWLNALAATADMLEAHRVLSVAVVDGTRERLESLNGSDVVGLVAVIQDLRRDLAVTEAYLAREVGRDDMAQREGTLPDGRTWSVRKGADRKGWDHDAWQRDVRAQVMSGMAATVVDVETGETYDVADLLAAVQAVHGSGAPRVTRLKQLGLDPGDYSETVPGPWSVQVSKGAEP